MQRFNTSCCCLGDNLVALCLLKDLRRPTSKIYPFKLACLIHVFCVDLNQLYFSLFGEWFILYQKNKQKHLKSFIYRFNFSRTFPINAKIAIHFRFLHCNFCRRRIYTSLAFECFEGGTFVVNVEKERCSAETRLQTLLGRYFKCMFSADCRLIYWG